VYKEAGVDPSLVSYVELHGTGTAAGDSQETNSAAEVFCSNGRPTPLLIGSIKSNMGHPEPAAGVAAIAKVLIAMHDHAIPANLHFSQPNPAIPGLLDGRLKVCLLQSFLQRVSTACYAERCISYDRFCLTIRPSDRPTVCHTLVSCQNDASYDRAVLTGG